jgi:hypothetical protein
MVDLGVAQPGFPRCPTQTLEPSVDVQEGQVARKCRMHDQFLLSRGWAPSCGATNVVVVVVMGATRDDADVVG